MHIATHPLTRASTFKHRPDTLIFAIFVTLLFLAPIPAGANREWGWAILLSCYALILIVQLTRNQYKISNEESCATTHRILIYSLLAVLAWQIIQVIPGLDLRTSEAADTSLNSLSRISNDPYSTFQSILKTSLYIITFVLALTFINSANRLRIFCLAIIASGLFQAAYGSLALFTDYNDWNTGNHANTLLHSRGTFVNKNHLAGFLELSISLCIGLLLGVFSYEKHDQWKLKTRFWLQLVLKPATQLRLFLVIMVIALVLTHSRMGNSAFFLSLSLTGFTALLIQYLRNRKLKRRSNIKTLSFLFASIILVDLLVIGNWFGMDKVVERVENTTIREETRFSLTSDILPVIKDNWLTGIGAGNFYSTYPKHQSENLGAFHDHAHNDILQTTLELGIPATLVLAAIVLYVQTQALLIFYRRNSRLYRGIALGSFMGITSLSIHSLSDFNLQIPANAMAFVSLLAIVLLCGHLDRHKLKEHFL